MTMRLTEEAWKEQLDTLASHLIDYRVAMVQAEKNPGEKHLHFTVASLTLQKIETLLLSLLKCNPYSVGQAQENELSQFAFTDWLDGHGMLGIDLHTCEGYIFFAYMPGNYPNRKDFLRATYTTLKRMHLCVSHLIELHDN